MAYNELEQRGTTDFPVSLYHLDKDHSRYHMAAHWHSEIELMRVLEGELSVTLNNNHFVAQKGDVVFVNSETVHRATPKDCQYECIVFHINFLYMDTHSCRFFIESLLNRDYLVTEHIPRSNKELNKAGNAVFDALKMQSSGYKFRAIAAFYNFFGIIIDSHAYGPSSGNAKLTDDKNIARLKKILSFIRENFDRPITLENMAQTADMSPKYFGSYFKNMTGKTPIEYLNEYRIEKACRKLTYTDNSVTEIAFSCGFNDLSYFIKTFKQVKGSSPGKFRNR
ncbi:MAG: helix-turn-helix domain-containing protein [Ruminococcaceae bacterium]|nr:helix-turn-helix domain-containing protein [Oscillospiraceae bacterium]